jgi:UDPglucose--hexose-1-phosphate uridylyltransferase
MVPGPPERLDPSGGAITARGAAEVILYTPEHHGSLGKLADNELALVVKAWRDRTEELRRRPEVAYVLCFENRGSMVGATIDHPHGQIYGFPLVPPRVRRIMQGPACRVCEDLAGASLVLHEDASTRCWVPRASAWPYAFRLAPRRHVHSLSDLLPEEEASWRLSLSAALQALDALWETSMPYMLDLHQGPCDGADWAGAHMWLELACPLRAPDVVRHVAAGEIGSGTFQNPVPPEAAAAALRRAWPRPPT